MKDRLGSKGDDLSILSDESREMSPVSLFWKGVRTLIPNISFILNQRVGSGALSGKMLLVVGIVENNKLY